MRKILNMARMALLITGMSCFMSAFALASDFGKVEIKNNWFYVDGEKFFVKGVNYEAYRPGQSPDNGDKVNLEMVDHDFTLIKEAGFNTIRTAGGMTPEIMTLAQKHGLWVMDGIWFNKDMDYADPQTLEYAMGLLKADIDWTKNYDNVLCYLFINEPDMERVRSAGKEKTEEFLRKLAKGVKALDPKRQVSFANWAPLAFIDHSFLDLVGMNAYIFSPNTISLSLGYRSYIEWLKKDVAKDKPLVITEFGLSVSKTRQGQAQLGSYGYGGNTVAEQATADVAMYNDLIQGGATGGCVFTWIDEWWMTGDKSVHDNVPEEYFGIVSMDEDPKGTPRDAYYALQQFNQALVIEPKTAVYYSGILPVEVYTTENVIKVQYKVDDQPWQDLNKDGSLWAKGSVDISSLPKGKHRFEVQALDHDAKVICNKSSDVLFGNASDNNPAYTVIISTDKSEYIMGDEVHFTISVTDVNGNPVAGKSLAYGLFQPIGWWEHGSKVTTDAQGVMTKQFSPMAKGFLTISAGVVDENKDGVMKRYGDIKVISIK